MYVLSILSARVADREGIFVLLRPREKRSDRKLWQHFDERAS